MSKVTAAWMLTALEGDNRNHVIGRALNALDNHNAFTDKDQRNGHITAIYYEMNKALLPWCVDLWMKVEPDTGLPRIVKYHGELNVIADKLRRKRNREARLAKLRNITGG